MGTKVTEEEFAKLESLAAAKGLTVGEWVREVQLDHAGDGKPTANPADQTLLAEVLALRTILLNLFYDLPNGEILT